MADAVDLGTEKKATKQPWTVERCKKNARRFATADDWKHGAPSSYKAAESKGWIKECCGHMQAGAKSTNKKHKRGKAGAKSRTTTHRKSA